MQLLVPFEPGQNRGVPLRRRPPCSNAEMAAAVKRMIRALSTRAGNGTPEDVNMLLDLEEELHKGIERAVNQLRAHGITDGEIGEALGMGRRNVSKRWRSDVQRRGTASPARHGRHPAEEAPR